jgi:hypothetical protein
MDNTTVATIIAAAGVVVLSFYTYYTWKMQRAVTRHIEAGNQRAQLLLRHIAASTELVNFTRKGASELAHQARLRFVPIFVVEIVQEHHEPRPGLSDFGYRFKLTNVGRGTALEVRIEDVVVPQQKAPLVSEDDARDYFLNARIAFSALPFVKPDQHNPITLEHRFLAGDAEYPFDLILYLLGKHGGDREFDLLIRFSDVEGNKYTQPVRTGIGGCKPGPVQLASEGQLALVAATLDETSGRETTGAPGSQSISIVEPSGAINGGRLN